MAPIHPQYILSIYNNTVRGDFIHHSSCSVSSSNVQYNETRVPVGMTWDEYLEKMRERRARQRVK